MTAHRSLILAVFLTLAAFVRGPVAAVSDPILDFTGGGSTFSDVDATWGWKFTVGVGSPITVGALGVFDVGADGLVQSHQIGLWTGTGSLLASTTIDNANSTLVDSTSGLGKWRSTPITPLALLPGDYVVGAFYNASHQATGGTDVDHLIINATASTLPGVTFGLSRFALGSSLVFPPTHVGDDAGYFGPNLFTVAATPPVPEPTSLILLVSGLAGLAGRMAWRKRRQK